VEIPAGPWKRARNLKRAGTRKLAEEIGSGPGRSPTWSLYPSPGFLTEVVHVYVAYKLSPHRLDSERRRPRGSATAAGPALGRLWAGDVDAKSIIGPCGFRCGAGVMTRRSAQRLHAGHRCFLTSRPSRAGVWRSVDFDAYRQDCLTSHDLWSHAERFPLPRVQHAGITVYLISLRRQGRAGVHL